MNAGRDNQGKDGPGKGRPGLDRPEKQAGNPPESLKGARIISYNLREEERPDGLKVRFKVRIETGRKAQGKERVRKWLTDTQASRIGRKNRPVIHRELLKGRVLSVTI